MRYVIIRDDDTNALTPASCLDRLYRPFLDRGFPVNLATIPLVATKTRIPDGSREGFLMKAGEGTPDQLAIGSGPELLDYLRNNRGYHLAQHGLTHGFLEFDSLSYGEAASRLDQGTQLLIQAGFSRPVAFVAPYDKISRGSYRAVAERFSIISTGWFELRRVPVPWWPKYLWKKLTRSTHWKVNRTRLLSHPGCLLSCYRQPETILSDVRAQVARHSLTVLVTHWWEYFRDNEENKPFIKVLHSVADYLASEPELKVISFEDLHTLGIAGRAFHSRVDPPKARSSGRLASVER